MKDWESFVVIAGALLLISWILMPIWVQSIRSRTGELIKLQKENNKLLRELLTGRGREKDAKR